MLPEKIYIDLDSVKRSEITSLASLIQRGGSSLAERPSNDSMNFSSVEIFRALDESEFPQWCFFEISLLRKFLQGEEVVDIKSYVINPGEYLGQHYHEAEPSLLIAPAPPKIDHEQTAKPPAIKYVGDYSALEDAFVLTAMVHHEALLYPRTVVQMCIKLTLDAYCSSEPDVNSRSYVSIKEKFKSLDLKMSTLSPIRLSMLKVPLLNHPEMLRTFLKMLKQYAEKKLPMDPNLVQKPREFLTKKDAQTMYNAACWEYPPGTTARTIAQDFTAYFGTIHRGKEIGNDTWLALFTGKLKQKAGGTAFIGKFYADLTSAGLAPSSIKGASSRGQDTLRATSPTTPTVARQPLNATKNSNRQLDSSPLTRHVAAATSSRQHADMADAEYSRNGSSEEEDEDDDSFAEMFRDDVQPTRKRQRSDT